MHLILLMFLLVMIAVVSTGVLRRRREHRRAELARALRYERWKARRQNIPNVSANLCGSGGPHHTAPTSRPPSIGAA
jgi:Tfp pilus assembly protein FimT